MSKTNYFKDIIGYENLKDHLYRIIDMLNNPDKYKALGCDMLNNLLLYGPPGTGKTSLATSLLKSVNRKSYIIRREGTDKDLYNELDKTFKDAIKNAPSIVLLDDLDKYTTDKDNQDIYSTIQTYIDQMKGKNVFIVATCNDYCSLPTSMRRKGRFDIKKEVCEPNEEDSKKIIEKYLKSKKIDKDVNIDHVNNMIAGHSCAELESVCKQAGIYAGYKNQDTIKMEDIINASLELIFGGNYDPLDELADISFDEGEVNISSNEKANLELFTAYHEAGHAIIQHYYYPQSIRFMSVSKNYSKYGIIEYKQNEVEDEYSIKSSLTRVLGGKAATEVILNKLDVGANSDLHKAYDISRHLVDNYCDNTFDAWFYNSNETSERTKSIKDEKSCELVEKHYNEAKRIISMNVDKVKRLANVLAERKVLFEDEINTILSGGLLDEKV